MPIKFARLSLILLTTLAGPLLAQENPCLNLAVPVDVITDKGGLLQSLSAQDFRGKLHGKSVEITSVATDEGPRRIAIVLDASGSMHDVWRLEVEEAERLVNANASSAFALVVFGTHVERQIGFDQGRNVIREELARVKALPPPRAGSQTALRDAVVAALDFFHPTQFGDTICLFTDAGDSASRASNSQFASAWKDSGVRLFALILTEPPNPGSTAEDVLGPKWLREYAIASGGDSIVFALGFDSKQVAAGKVPNLGQEVIDSAPLGFDNEIARPYRVTIKLPEPLNKPREWDLNVVDAKGKINRNLRILYPSKLGPCQ